MANDKKISILLDLVISKIKKLPENEQKYLIIQLVVKLKTAGYGKFLEGLL